MIEIIPHCRKINIRKIGDTRGSVNILEFGNEIPFKVKRVYYLTQVPDGQIRGAHAHRKLQQVIIPIHGSFTLRVSDGCREQEIFLNEPDTGVFIGAMVWREIKNFSEGAVCLCLASELFDENDYIRSYTDFLEEVRHSHRQIESVPYFDLNPLHSQLKDRMIESFEYCLDRNQWILGTEVQKFEKAFAEYRETEEAIGVGNGLDALSLILEAMGIGDGDEVMVPSQTFIATWLAVTRVGATPVPVDVEEESGLIDLRKLDAAKTEKTKACIAVHLYGRMVDMKRLAAWGRKHNVAIIEDAAQAHGSSFNGTRAGAFSKAAAFSFYPTKNLGALGDGGAVVTNDTHLARRIRLLRNYGSEKKYEHILPGSNSRLDELQASFLNIKLPYLDEQNRERKILAERYFAELSNIEDLKLPKSDTSLSQSAWHIFAIRSKNRDDLRNFLEASGIQTMIHYPMTPSESEAYGELKIADLNVGAAWSRESLSLPLFVGMTAAQQTYVIHKVREYFELQKEKPDFKAQLSLEKNHRPTNSRPDPHHL